MLDMGLVVSDSLFTSVQSVWGRERDGVNFLSVSDACMSVCGVVWRGVVWCGVVWRRHLLVSVLVQMFEFGVVQWEVPAVSSAHLVAAADEQSLQLGGR